MEDLVAAAREWAAQHVSRGSVPAQVDLDDLTKAEMPPLAVVTALACGTALLDEVRRADMSTGIDVLVVIPLDWTDGTLRTDPPSVLELTEQEWAYGAGLEVPGLYLLPRTLLGEHEHTEEYRVGIDSGPSPAHFAAYYRCWRSADGRREGEDFARALYFRSVVGQCAFVWH